MGVSGGMVVGVPLATIVASILPVQFVLVAFACINAVTLVATIVFVPSMPVQTKTSYLKQVSAVKTPTAIVSLAATMLIQAAIFATYAYAAEYLAGVGGVTARCSPSGWQAWSATTWAATCSRRRRARRCSCSRSP